MSRGELFPIINCADLVTARRWYERVLFAILDYQFPEDGEPEYLTLRIGSGQLGLGRGTGPTAYGATPLPATGHAVDICLYVPDLDAVIAAAAASDVAVPPADMPWGERVAYLRDPEGTMLLIIQEPNDVLGSEEDLRAELIAIDDAWAAALVDNDADRMGSFMADEWVIVSESGISTKEDFLGLIRSADLTHSAMDRISQARVRFYGDTAVVSSRVTNTAHYRGQRFDADEWTTSVFARRGGTWLCVLSQITGASG